MKKLVVSIVLILLLLTGGIYILIPRTAVVSVTGNIGCTLNSTNRFVTDSAAWIEWLPASASSNGFAFKPGKKGFNSIDVLIENKDIAIESRITLLPVKKDSVFLEWRGIYPTGNNPFAKIGSYRTREAVSNSMKAAMAHLQSFLENSANIYGNPVERAKVKDTLLIATQIISADTPSIKEIYRMIDLLKEHIKKEGAQETGYPMLHTQPAENSGLETMVAIPVNRSIKETATFFKRVMVPGNILIMETKGGPQAIRHAYRQLENYLSDYHMESPAKPFESLVTNRVMEPDTAKWVTRLYYPVF